MNYRKFIDGLPNLYENRGQDSVIPKSSRFKQVLAPVKGMTNALVMQAEVILWKQDFEDFFGESEP